jgi:DNA-binding beta-propeller fold protein YncE
VAVDSATGDLYIADYDNSEVEQVTPQGALSIVAGTGSYGIPTPGLATSSELGSPSAVAVDPTTGDLYIADPFNAEIELVTPQGALSIVAGTGAAGAPTPGLATSSELNLPHGLATDPTTGDLYIADYDNSEVEQVTPQGALSIVAGTGTAGAPTPGPASQSELDDPLGVGVNPGTGVLYIADTSNNEIERVGPPPPPGTRTTTTTTPPVTATGGHACPAPSGSLNGSRLGPVPLGITRTRVRKALTTYSVTHAGFDRFCLAGGPGILAGYPSARLLRTMTAHQRTRVRGRVVLVLTANRHYAVDQITAGTRVARARRHLAHARELRIGADTWYVLHDASTTRVLEVRGGTVEDVGIANHALTATPTEQRRLLSSF